MKRDPKNSRRPNDGAANLAMLKRTVKKLFSYYPVLAPVTFACILFSAIVTSIPSLFVQNVIQVIEKWYVSRDWVSAKAELIPILSLLISLYVLSIIAILVYKQLMAYMTQGFLDKLRQEMFGGMQDLPIRYFDTHQHGDIMTSTPTISTRCASSCPKPSPPSSSLARSCWPCSALCSISVSG